MHNKTYENIKLTQKKQPGLVAFYNIPSGNGVGLLSKRKIGTGGDK